MPLAAPAPVYRPIDVDQTTLQEAVRRKAIHDGKYQEPPEYYPRHVKKAVLELHKAGCDVDHLVEYQNHPPFYGPAGMADPPPPPGQPVNPHATQPEPVILDPDEVLVASERSNKILRSLDRMPHALRDLGLIPPDPKRPTPVLHMPDEVPDPTPISVALSAAVHQASQLVNFPPLQTGGSSGSLSTGRYHGGSWGFERIAAALQRLNEAPPPDNDNPFINTRANKVSDSKPLPGYAADVPEVVPDMDKLLGRMNDHMTVDMVGVHAALEYALRPLCQLSGCSIGPLGGRHSISPRHRLEVSHYGRGVAATMIMDERMTMAELRQEAQQALNAVLSSPARGEPGYMELPEAP